MPSNAPSATALALAAVVCTALACLVARYLRGVRGWLPGLVQYLCGLFLPPALTFAAYAHWGAVARTPRSGAVLLVGWLACVLVGALFARQGRDRPRQRHA